MTKEIQNECSHLSFLISSPVRLLGRQLLFQHIIWVVKEIILTARVTLKTLGLP